MKAMQTLRTPVTPFQLGVMRRQFEQEIKPWLNIKMKIYSCAVPTLIIGPGEKMETKYNFSPEVIKTLCLIDDQIEEAQLRIFGTTVAVS